MVFGMEPYLFRGRYDFGAADRGNDDFAALGLLDLEGFFDGDFVKWIDRHLDVVQFDAGLVAFHPDFHIRVDDALDWYQDFHREALALES